MEGEVFFGRYRISRDPQGKPAEAGRTGAASSYKAVDGESAQPVLLQLVPLAAIDQARRAEFEARAKAVREVDHVNVARVLAAGVQHDSFAFVTEYLDGETADAWIVAHGTMTPDAVLRIGVQVVRATAAAAFHGLTHRALQPSNIIILHGESPSGGWPFIKLLNFGVAALELHGETNEARELAPAVVPQFASPEQVRNQQIDFRSEMYSLGATMCFLLTGAVPLPNSDDANTKRRGRRRLPELSSMPMPVRRLLGSMLAENPEDRPLDPVALERYMATILGVIERRQAWGRKFGIPLAASVQRKIVRSRSPFAQVVRGGLAVAALLIALAALGAILYPEYFHRSRSVKEMGVSVGVPTAEQTNVPPPATTPWPAKIVSTSQSPAAPSIPPIQSAPIAHASAAPSASLAQNVRPGNASAAAETKVTPPSSSTLANVGSLPQQPAASPATPPSQPSAAQAAAASSGSFVQNAPPNNSTASTSTAKPISPSKTMTARANADVSALADREPEPPSAGPDDEDESPSTTRSKHPAKAQSKVTTRSKTKPVARSGARTRASKSGRWSRATFIGMTPMGRMLFRMPSGKIVAMTPRNRRAPVAARRRIISRPPEPQIYYGPPPYGYPPGY